MQLFTFILIWVITAIGVLSRGLYFDHSFYPIHLCILILFIIFLLRIILYKEDQIKPFLVFICIPVFYLLAFLFEPASKLLSMTTFFRSTSYLAFYLMAYWVLKTDKKYRDWMPYFIQSIGLIIAGQMILARMGMLGTYSTILNRYAGVFEYPNTFGLVMTAFFLFSLLAINQKAVLWNKLFFLFTLPIYLAMLLGSNSRGVMLLLPFVFLIALIMVSANKQIYLIIIGLSSFIFAVIFNGLLSNEKYILAFLSLIVLSGVLVLFDRLLNQIPDLGSTQKYMRFIIPGSIVLVGLIFLVDFMTEGFIYRSLPINFQERINHFGQISTLRERGLFLKDGLQMSRDHILFGQGGRTWEMNYRTTQSLPYQSNESHNGFIEMILDIGWLGFFVLISLLIPFLLRVIKSYNQNLTKYIIPVLLVISHSFIDFNFSYGLVWFIFLWMIAAILADVQLDRVTKFVNCRLVYPTCIVLLIACSLITITFSYRFIQADNNYRSYQQSGNPRFISVAAKQNPYDPAMQLSYFEEQLKQNKLTENEIIDESGKVATLSPSNSRHLSEIALRLNAYGYPELSYDMLHQALQVDKLESRLYEVISDLSLKLFKKTNDRDYLNKNIEMYEELSDVHKMLTNHPHFHDHNSRKFMLTKNLIERIAVSYYLLDELEQLTNIISHLPRDHELYQLIIEFNETKEDSILSGFLGDIWNQY